MRVIAGSAGGRRLRAVAGKSTRPTSDRVKESLFAILSPVLVEARVLDLFAGTGALGIEALSRGAKECVFVDSSGPATATISENLGSLGLADRSRVLRRDALAALNELSGQPQFDLVFIDPPYASRLGHEALAVIARLNMVTTSGVAVAEYSAHNRPDAQYLSMVRYREEKYGETLVGFYVQRPEE